MASGALRLISFGFRTWDFGFQNESPHVGCYEPKATPGVGPWLTLVRPFFGGPVFSLPSRTTMWASAPLTLSHRSFARPPAFAALEAGVR